MGVEEQLQPGEEILYRAQVTRVSLLPLALLLVLIAGAGIFFWRLAEEQVVLLVAGISAAVVAIVLGVKYLVLRSHEYVLTNRRVVQQTGILAKRSNDSHLDKVNNVEHRQTLWGRLLGYGDVAIDTASETGTTVFARISAPLDFKRAILGAREQYRVGFGAGIGAMPLMAPAPSGAERLRQLKALLDDRLISPEEYEAKRRQLLSEL